MSSGSDQTGICGAENIWRTVDVDPTRIAHLAAVLNIPSAAATVLAARPLSDAGAVSRFLHPALSDLSDPLILPGMQSAVARLCRALDAREEIVVFGDYDADGVTSVALLLQVLRALGATVTPCLSNRSQGGYGFIPAALARCRELGRPSLVVTVDTGITAVDTCALAAAAGIDVIITDHHEPGLELPQAAAIVNPKLGGPPATWMLAGVGVVYYLCRALVAARKPPVDFPGIESWLDLVMLGTIADVAPLLDDNRILVWHGLDLLHSIGRPGLQALIERSGINGEISAGRVAFGLAPRINAVGRLQTPDPALELLLTDDPSRATVLAAELDSANRARQDIEGRIYTEAIEQIEGAGKQFDPANQFGLVVASKGWHPGVIGIVASRLVAAYYRPVVVVSFDEDGHGRGSARGIEDFNLLECLRECSEHLTAVGGHTSAAGLGLRQETLPAFRTAFNAAAAARLRGVDLRPVQRVDCWVELSELDMPLLEALQCMQPFGQGHPTPVFAARKLRAVGTPRVVGRNHLKLTVTDGSLNYEAIAFGRADKHLPEVFDMAFQLEENVWQGRSTLQLNVQDWRRSQIIGHKEAQEAQGTLKTAFEIQETR